MSNTTNTEQDTVKRLFTVGAHIGYSKSHRHPSMEKFIYGTKNRSDIIDLTKTVEAVEKASSFLSSVAEEGGTILLVGGKAEAHSAIHTTGEATGMPYVVGRWIGGILTNFSQIRRQVNKLQSLRDQREKGEFSKYTKREQLSFDREIADLEKYYAGLIPLTERPKAIVIVDPKQEIIAVREALGTHVPIVALASTDCSVQEVDYPIPVNDRSKSSIDTILEMIKEKIDEGLEKKPQTKEENTNRSSQRSQTKQTVTA